MKKIYLSCLLVLSCHQIIVAENIIVTVSDFSFSPSTFTVNAGDTVTWVWSSGVHTTTSAIIPSGAASWDQPITTGSPMFSYITSVPGQYGYVCTPHASMGMAGSFTVTSSTGITSPVPEMLSLEVAGTGESGINITYGLPVAQTVSIRIFNVIGSQLEVFTADQPAGTFNRSLTIANLNKGVYIIELQGRSGSVTKKLFIQ